MKIDYAWKLMAAAAALMALSDAAHAQNAAAGATVFAQCEICHTTDGSASIGPTLKGVVGRTAGTAPGFAFSPAMKAVGKAWDAKSLDAFVTDPQAAVPGNQMPFPGVADAKDRANLVAYLATLK